VSARLHEDGRCRCHWPGVDPVYVAYHDTEWGVPEWDGRALFEKLLLDGFQAGLSWITILRKRDNFRLAFAGFDPEEMARFGDVDIARLMADPGIVRNRSKIEAAILSARAYLDMESRGEPFADFIWSHVDGRPVQNRIAAQADIPTKSEMSVRLSKSLAARGFKFCGPTITYAFAEAVGMVNDHLVGCFRHAECAALAERPDGA
jgi:DNA-3-methyladenine glycosylase I